MNPKERVIAALKGEHPDIVPVTFDYLELFLEEAIERAYLKGYHDSLVSKGCVRVDCEEDAAIWASAIVGALDGAFREPFDWIPLPGGFGPERPAKRELRLLDGRVFDINLETGSTRGMLRPPQETKTEEIGRQLERPELELSSRGDVEGFLAERYRRRVLNLREEIDVARHVVNEHGGDRFLYIGVSAPFVEAFSILGFEGLMLSMLQSPRMLHQLLSGVLEQSVERARGFAAVGVHGVRIEEMLVGADTISPGQYVEFAYPYERTLVDELSRMGFFTFLYFGGDVMPRLPWIVELGIDGLAVEESKKGFTIDIVKVRESVGEKLCLVGNIDSFGVIHHGSRDEIAREVARQLGAAGRGGAFMVGIGSPLPLDTDVQQVNIAAGLARQLGTYDNMGGSHHAGA